MQKSKKTKTCKCCEKQGVIYKHGLIRECYDRRKQEEIDVYTQIWNTRKRKDFETGKSIYGHMKLSYFHHVLPKSKYPEYRLCLWNIILVSDLTHAQAELNLKKTPKIEAYTKYLEEHHKELYESTDTSN